MHNMRSARQPNLSATVMASAGTGKTWLLVTRAVRLLLAGTAPDAILAVTFTRKAAAEMAERLMQRLAELAGADEAGRRALLGAMGIAPASALRQFLDHRSDWGAYIGDEPAPVRYASERLADALGIDSAADPLATVFS